MIRKAIPVLTHVDNLSDMKIDMSAQEETLQQIANNTTTIQKEVENIHGLTASTEITTGLIRTFLGPPSASMPETVIGLLRSIANKLS